MKAVKTDNTQSAMCRALDATQILRGESAKSDDDSTPGAGYDKRRAVVPQTSVLIVKLALFGRPADL